MEHSPETKRMLSREWRKANKERIREYNENRIRESALAELEAAAAAGKDVAAIIRETISNDGVKNGGKSK